MSVVNLRFLFLLTILVLFQGSYVLCDLSSNSVIDPFGLLKQRDGIAILKANCVKLCNECNGIATSERNACKCQILTDYPQQCLEKIQRKAKLLGLSLSSKKRLRTKRCLGGGTGFPLSMFGIGLSKAGSDQLNELGDQVLEEPTESLNSLAGIIAAPLMEQIRAIFGGDQEMAHETIPGQMVSHLPKALSAITGLFDTFNVAAPTPQKFVGSGQETGDGTENGDFEAGVLGAIPVVNQLRSVFVGDPQTGNVDNTLPVQFARTLPMAVNSLVELISTFGNAGNIGARSSANAKPPVDKSWLYEDDDDDDDTKNDGETPLGSPAQKIIVSPFITDDKPPESPDPTSVPPITNEQLASSSDMSDDLDDQLSTLDALIKQNIDTRWKNLLGSSNSPQVIKPEETVIIISPTNKFAKPFIEAYT